METKEDVKYIKVEVKEEYEDDLESKISTYTPISSEIKIEDVEGFAKDEPGIFLPEIKMENMKTETKDFSNKIHDSLDDTEKEKFSECEICHKKFKERKHLNQHMRRLHKERKSLECEICSKSFSAGFSLRNHMRIHTGEMPFQCKICSRKFTRKDFMKKHLITHSEEKSYTCEVCLRPFSLLSNLQRHIRIHTGI
ncbi:zinc finger protein 345-like isoform X3 [Diabrotica virgifera virgifera]|uniref:Zinc finger protein 345-like isoform X2 n=1 Tax=Diabrotica virgifera virgifera TaxID=50390 RepID=A0A6P7GTY5_DIAVI|nr:zinc finger protein 345-like isoform X3 [Diabrotica virgifera virgifera]